MAESREGILSALGQYARGATAIPGQVAGYAEDVIESDAPLQKVTEDVTALGVGMGQAIAEDPIQFGLEILPGVGNVMAFREAEDLRAKATEARESGDEETAEGLEAAAAYAMSGVVPGGNILKALRRGGDDVFKMQQDPVTGTRTATLERPFKTRGRDFLETLDGDFPEQDLINRIEKAGLPATDTEMILQAIGEASRDNKGRVNRFDLLDKYADKSIEDRTFIDIVEPQDSNLIYGNMDNVHGSDKMGVVRLGVDYKDPVDSRGLKLFNDLTNPIELAGLSDNIDSLNFKISQLYEVNPDVADVFDSRKNSIHRSAKKLAEKNSESLGMTTVKYGTSNIYSVASNPYTRQALEKLGVSIDEWNDMMTFDRQRAESLLPQIKEEGEKIAVGETYDLIKNADLNDPKLGLRSYEIRTISSLRDELDNIPSVEAAFMFGSPDLKPKLLQAAEHFKDGEARLVEKVLKDEIDRVKNELNRKGLFASEIGELPTEHSSLNVDKANAVPLSFMRYADIEAFQRTPKGQVYPVGDVMHFTELQSDYDDLLRKRGPRGKGGRKGDLLQDDMLLGEQLELEVKLDDLNNRRADLLGDDTLDDPAFIADEAKRKEFESLDRQVKSLESQIMSIKGQRKTINKRISTEFTDSDGRPAPYDVAELYPGQAQRSQVQQINDMVGATLASVQRNKVGATFPVPDPMDSKQSQLYQNVLNNAREAAKRLGPDFRVEFVETLVRKDPSGNDLQQPQFRKRVGIFHQDAETARRRAKNLGLEEGPDGDVDYMETPAIGKGDKGVKMFETGGIVSLPRRSRGKEGIADVIRKYRREGLMD